MKNSREFREESVRGFLHNPTAGGDAGMVLTHGAGSNCNAPLLVALAEAFCAAGFTVLRCDLPFRQVRPQGPPPRGAAELDRKGLEAAIACMRRMAAGPLILGGHSYGGRQASILAAEQPGLADRLLLLSYPLHPPQRPQELRTAHFPQLQISSLFVHGTRDGFGSIAEMTQALQLIPAPTKLLPVASAGHELLSRSNQSQLTKMIVDACPPRESAAAGGS